MGVCTSKDGWVESSAMAPGRFATCMASCPRLMDLGCGFHWSLFSGTRSSTRRVAWASYSSSWTISLTVSIGSSANERVYVAVRVLEPGRLHAATFVDIALECQARHGVVLEADTLGFESLHNFLHVIPDEPSGGGCLVAAGKLRAVHQDFGTAGLIGQRLLLLCSNQFETQGALVEALGSLEIANRNRRHGFLTAQHSAPHHWMRLLSDRHCCPSPR